MRIEINEETEKLLDEIRAENHVYGKGHTATVMFLVRYYKRHGTLEKVLNERLGEIPPAIEQAVRNVFRDFILNLTKPRENNNE